MRSYLTALARLAVRACRAIRAVAIHGPREMSFRVLRHLRIVETVRSLDVFVSECRGSGCEDSHGLAGPGVRFAELLQRSVVNRRFSFAEGLPAIGWIEIQYTRGARAFAAMEGDLVIAMVWLHLSAADLTYIHQPSVEVSPGYVYVYGVVTSPAFRGKGVASALKAHALATVADSTVRFAASAVLLDNPFGQQWHRRKMHEIHAGRITYMRRGGKDRWLVYRYDWGRPFPLVISTGDSTTGCESLANDS